MIDLSTCRSVDLSIDQQIIRSPAQSILPG